LVEADEDASLCGWTGDGPATAAEACRCESSTAIWTYVCNCTNRWCCPV